MPSNMSRESCGGRSLRSFQILALEISGATKAHCSSVSECRFIANLLVGWCHYATFIFQTEPGRPDFSNPPILAGGFLLFSPGDPLFDPLHKQTLPVTSVIDVS